MKVSLSWLKDYVDVQMDPAELAEALTMAGLEVEAVADRYSYLQKVLVGRIEAVEDHPNAEQLKICRVHLPQRELTVVCGAPNVKTGMLAPVALPGTVFPDGTVLEKNVIRGQASEAMLCSDMELGLGSDPGGIMELDGALKPGDRLAEALKLSDTVFEFDLTPNRPDCLSVIGIAREVAAIQKTTLRYPDFSLEDRGNRIAALTSVTIEAPDHCPRYSARLVDAVRVKTSPFWLQDRLLSIGLRPINNIVDITNFVLMETGQPLHAFDFDRLAENRIVVRTARAGEKFVTLDQNERVLDAEMLMICDGQKPVAVGGVMGGLNSEIETGTSRVLIESAYFNPVSIRKTSKKLGLNTEASHRFERGVDPEGTVRALNRAARLMAELGGGTLVEGLIDEYPQPQKSVRISMSVQRTRRLLGIGLDAGNMKNLLESIEFEVDEVVPDDDDHRLEVTAPTFRVDISRPEDLMEEVARLAGYDNIPISYPAMPAEARPVARQIEVRRRLRQLMTGFGFSEVITYSFVHRQTPQRLGLAATDPRCRQVEILNPLTEDQAVMRTSLIPGLLETMRYNLTRQIKTLKIFEVGKIFIPAADQLLPREPEILAALWTGMAREASWHGPAVACDYFDIKGVVEGLLAGLKIDGLRFTRIAADACDYTRAGYCAWIMAGDTRLGRVGEIHPRLCDRFELKQSAYIFELELDHLIPLIPTAVSFKPLPIFPAIYRDITIIVDQAVEAQLILETVENMGEALVESVHLFAVFEGDPIAAGKKSVSFRLTYRSHEKTLVDEDVNQLHKSITARLLQAFDAGLPA